MRYFYLFLLLFGCGIAAHAQSPLDRTVNFKVKNEPLPEALYTLSEKAGITISFSNSILPAGKFITVNLKKTPLRQILKIVLKDTNLSFVTAGEMRILIVEMPAPPPTVRLTLSGYLLDADSGEPLIGAAIQDSLSGKGTFSNAYGFYSLTLPAGVRELKVSYLGYRAKRAVVRLFQRQKIDFELEQSIYLNEVVIYASEVSDRAAPIRIGTEEVFVRDIAAGPGIGGESDVVRAVHKLPGVQTGADGYGGFTVRGGNVDQNLVLLDGVPVYNSLHALGLYSIFNPNTISRTQVLKGIFPARYGGRISSVLDVRTKEGNNRKLSGGAEVGLLSGSAILEGPLENEKSSFLISGRRSFLDFYTRPISRSLLETDSTSGDIGYYFYDLNGKVNHRFNDRNKVYLSFYAGRDVFTDILNEERRVNFFAPAEDLPDSTVLVSVERRRSWGNVIASGRWNHTFSDKTFANTTVTYTRFFFQNIQPGRQVNKVDGLPVDTLFNVRRFNSNNQDLAAKIDFDYRPNSEHYLRFGASATAHRFQPRIIQFNGNIPVDTFNQVVEGRVDRSAFFSIEYDAYFEDDWKINDRWQVNLGVRLSVIQSPGKVYFRPQPRFIFSYRAAKDFYLQGGVGLTTQAVHLLTTTGQGRAEDLWVSATSRYAPIQSRQATLGLEYNPGDYWTLSVEGYIKDMDNLISFQEGLIQNIDAVSWQNAVVTGSGEARGLEFSAMRTQGRFTAAVHYTLGSTTRRFPARNQGNSYRHQFDRRHNFNLNFSQRIGKHAGIHFGFVYQSGALTSVPQASYLFTVPSLLFPFQGNVLVYSGLSNVELPNYHRIDLGADWEWNDKPIKHLLKIGVYNVYNRLNPSYYNVSDDCEARGLCYKQVTLVPILPYVRYGIRF